MKKILVFCLIVSMLFSVSCSREVYITGDVDYYYESGYNLSPFESTLLCVYSVDFVKKFDAVDFSFHYYEAPPVFILGCCAYDISVVSITYSQENYYIAKQDLFDNTEYRPTEPQYVYNGYDFYKNNYSDERHLFLNAFNDSKYTIVLMGFYASVDSRMNIDISNEEWPEFLRTYYGEYYDFDA